MNSKPTCKELEHRINELENTIKSFKLFENLLKESKDEHRFLLENINDVIYTLDHKGCILYVSPVAEEITKYKVDELIGRNIFEIVHPEDLPGLLSSFERTLHGKLAPYEYRLFDKDGSIRYVRSYSKLLYKEDQLIGMTGIISDISDQKNVEGELKEIEERYKAIFDRSLDCIYVHDFEGNFIDANDETLIMTGYSEKEIRSLNFSSFLSSDQIFTAIEGTETLIQSGFEKGLQEYKIKCKEGEFKYIEARASLLYKDGKPYAIQGVARDITERKRAEEEIKSNEARFRELFNNMRSGVAVYEVKDNGNDFIFKDINRAGERIEKIKKENLIGKSVLEIFPGVKEYGLFDVLKRVWETGKPEHFPTSLYKDERIMVWRESFVYKLPSGEMVTVYDDITERKQAEKALKEAYDIVNRSQSVAFLWKNAEGWPVEYVSNNVKELFGYTAEEFTSGKVPYATVVHPDDIEKVTEEISDHSKDKRINYFIHEPYRIITKNGKTIWLDDRTHIRRDKKGKITHYEGIVIDITDRVRAEKSLKESHETFLMVLDGMDSTIYVADMETYEILFMNKKMKDNFASDLTGKICWEALRNESGPCSFCTNDKLLDENGKPTGVLVWHDQNTVSGSWFINYDRAIKWVNERYVRLQVATDITDLKKMEEQLLQAQKMDAIGTLAGGVAHDFNNILTAIIGYADLALMTIGKDGPLREEIEEIKIAGERAAALTRQLLAFSRKQIIQPRVMDLNKLIADLEKMLGRLVGEDIELLTIFEPVLWQVKTDPGQMEQVIMNMAVNARDAMPMGGKLTIETANVYLEENYFRMHGTKEQTGPYVMMSISDTGTGIDEETQSYIFDPFFTTKKVGRGTGMGLSTVYGIVKQNNGFIWVYSEPIQGSTFKIYLPKIKGNAEPEGKEQPPVGEFVGSETVLIVEDDDSLRKLAQKTLQQYGYRVLAAENGEDALRVSEAHEGSIDLLITDVVMPKMSGKETAERLQPLYPHMKVVYMSGYTDNAIVRHGVLEPGLNFLEKPFTPDGLARKVREVLGA